MLEIKQRNYRNVGHHMDGDDGGHSFTINRVTIYKIISSNSFLKQQ